MAKGTNSGKLQLGFSPMSKRIILAKMVDIGNGLRRRVGNEERDVSNEATQLAWQLVMAEGGEVSWETENGSVMVLSASLTPAPDKTESVDHEH